MLTVSLRFSGSWFLKITLTTLLRDTVTGFWLPGTPSSWAVSVPFSSVTVMPMAAFEATACDPFSSISLSAPVASSANEQAAPLSVLVVGWASIGRCPSTAITAPVLTRPSAAIAQMPVTTPFFRLGFEANRKPPTSTSAPAMMNTTGPPLLSIHNMMRENE